MGWQVIVFEYVCPVGGCLLASSVFAAPIKDLNQALRRGSLGSLNTIPWAVMTGNCLGWCAYAYYTADPFVLASNLPGLILSLWLNIGACKLQYLAQIDAIRRDFRHGGMERDNDNDNHNDNGNEDEPERTTETRHHHKIHDLNHDYSTSLSWSQQDVVLLRIVTGWAAMLVAVGWMGGLHSSSSELPYAPHTVVGILVNINLVFFYGAPLQTMKTVLETRSSDTIHTPTVTRNIANALFWISYGFARNDAIIYGPNGVGFLLGLAQCALLVVYPKTESATLSAAAVAPASRFYASAPTIDDAIEGAEVEFATLPAFVEDETISSVVQRRIV